jgi:hypothetical protein
VHVHADIPEIDAVILGGYDDKANAFGVNGVREIGVCGSGAAIASAVFNATGVRVRAFPVTVGESPERPAWLRADGLPLARARSRCCVDRRRLLASHPKGCEHESSSRAAGVALPLSDNRSHEIGGRRSAATGACNPR